LSTAARLVLVTGGAGFIGRHLVRQLVERGERVRVLDLDPVDEPGIESMVGSVLDAEKVSEAMRGAERVYHAAANPNLWARDKSQFYEVNTRGTEIVLAAAWRAGVARFVYTSTESILKGVARRRAAGPTDETATPRLADMPGPYCRSKFLAERLALDAAARGMPVVVVNPTLPMGPGDRRLTPPSRMLLGFLRGEMPAYLDSAFNIVDVRDAALGHILAAEHGRVGERYILGGENLRLSEVLAHLQRISGRRMPHLRVPPWLALASGAISELISDYVTRRPPKAPLTGVRLALQPMLFDNAKAMRELGFKPRPARESLVDAVAWFESEGLLP